MENKILFVGGNWDLNGGRKSKVVDEFSKYLPEATVFNGGNYNDLNKILESCTDYDTVIWWANVPNELPKIRNVKDINYKTMLVSSKRNIDNKYSFQDLLQRSFALKSNLTIEFSKNNDLYSMRLFDPLGNVWYEGTDIKKCSEELIDRLNFIKSITRESTISSDENIGALALFFNMFKEEMYKSDNEPTIPIKKTFLNIVRDYAVKFAEATFDTKDVKRFLGNASFRCPKGFPSFRDGKYIFVSKRNVNKEFIGIDEFVPVYLEDGKVYYCGDNKPSVDTPIQVRLYDLLPNINYMIHSHCYIDDAPFTQKSLPCGAIEEVDEVLNLLEEEYDNDLNKDFYLINLTGHGSIMMSKEPEQLMNIEMTGRKLPENMYKKKLVRKLWLNKKTNSFLN